MAKLKILKSETKIMEFLNLKNPNELLFIYPYRYDDNKIIDFTNWKVDERIFFNATLLNKPQVSRFNKISLARFDVIFQENIISCVIYNRTWISKLSVGTKLNITGKYTGNNKVTVSNYNSNDIKDEVGLFPIYRLTTGININTYRKFVKKVYDYYQGEIIDLMPKWIIEKYKLLDYGEALKLLHFPKNLKQVELGIRTLKYHEFIRFHLINLMQKNKSQDLKLIKNFSHDSVFQVANTLNFNLTNDQRIATNEILNDLSSDIIMNRLLQGDVGSGKTLVAALAMYATVLAKQQTAFMAPTEILAIQQTKYLKQLFKRFDLNIVCLYSALKTYKKTAILEEIANGEADIVVGTHSLIQDKIKFNNLGLVVIDEQQRFGVKQRDSLNQKGINTDQLLMTATPIPRTMASVIYSDMDISTIKELPLGRKDIKSKLILENSMRTILDDILSKIEEGELVYVVCPAIEDSEDSEMANVEKIYKNLDKEINKVKKLNIPIGLLHGKMDSSQKDQVMENFKSSKVKILVTTTVIEVGINVKEANVMVIYDADRFGMSQLHQLRGRVGRGEKQGYCYFLTNSKNVETLEKLKIIETNLDGFEISQFDLKLRGPGDIIGTRQSGIDNFVLGDLIIDQVMLQYALNDAKEILSEKNIADNNDIIQDVYNYLNSKNKMLES